jgi:hypothetical protein
MMRFVITLTAAACLSAVAVPLCATRIPVYDLREVDGLHRPWLPQSLRAAEFRIHVEAYWQQLAECNRVLGALRAVAHKGGNP